MSEYVAVLTTTDSREVAEKIALSVLEKKVAACVQIVGPIRSFYWWKGRIDSSEEYLLLIKSKLDVYDELEKEIKRAHNYEVPQIITIPVKAGFEKYLKWVDSVIG